MIPAVHVGGIQPDGEREVRGGLGIAAGVDVGMSLMPVQERIEGAVADAHGVRVDGFAVHGLAAQGAAVLDPFFGIGGIRLGGGLQFQGKVGNGLSGAFYMHLSIHRRHVMQGRFGKYIGHKNTSFSSIA